MEFSLLGQTINISNGRRHYMVILGQYRKLADEAENTFTRLYDDTAGST